MIRRLTVVLALAAVVGACGVDGNSSTSRLRNTTSCVASESERVALLAPISESITTATNQIAALPSFVVLRQNVEIAFLELESAQNDFTVVEVTRTQTYADIKASVVGLSGEELQKKGKENAKIAADIDIRWWGAKDLVERRAKEWRDAGSRLQLQQAMTTLLATASTQRDTLLALPICVSQQPATEESVTEETVTEDTVVEDTAAEETVTEDTAVEDTAVEETVTEDTVVEDAAAEETVTEDTAAEDTSTSSSQVSTTSKKCRESVAALPPEIMYIGEKYEMGMPDCVFEDGVSMGLVGTQGLGKMISGGGSRGQTVYLEPDAVAERRWVAVYVRFPGESEDVSWGRFVEVQERKPDKCEGLAPTLSPLDDELRVTAVSTCADAIGIEISVWSDVGNWLLHGDDTESRTITKKLKPYLSAHERVKVLTRHVCAGEELKPCGLTTAEMFSAPMISSVNPAVHPCLDPQRPGTLCMWAVLDDDTRTQVKSSYMCSFENCGQGAHQGRPVALMAGPNADGSVTAYGGGGIYESSTNRFYPWGKPGAWYTGGDSWVEIQKSLSATAPPPDAAAPTTIVPSNESSTTTSSTTTTVAPSATTPTTTSTTTMTVAPSATTTTTTSTTTTTVAPSATTTTTAGTTSQPADTPTVSVVVPLPVSAMTPEPSPSAAQDTTGNEPAVSIAQATPEPLPIAVVDGATTMICDQECLADARDLASADDDAKVEIELAPDVWMPADGLVVPLDSSGTKLRIRVTPTSGEPVIIGGEVASVSEQERRHESQTTIVSLDGTVTDGTGAVIAVGAVEDEPYGFWDFVKEFGPYGGLAMIFMLLVAWFTVRKIQTKTP